MPSGAGAGVDSAWDQKKLEATLREMLESRTVPQCPVHTILVSVQDALLDAGVVESYSTSGDSPCSNRAPRAALYALINFG